MRASDMINRCTVALDSLNYSKNRYTDVLPRMTMNIDDNRVILKRCTDYRSSARGYINASFVTTSESVSRFIATQGPLSHTSEDFWEMIIQYHCPVIVMLTRLVDNYGGTELKENERKRVNADCAFCVVGKRLSNTYDLSAYSLYLWIHAPHFNGPYFVDWVIMYCYMEIQKAQNPNFNTEYWVYTLSLARDRHFLINSINCPGP
ncbi:UNVERIFIED_CONTAM: Protein-tyrosine-phosphatase PTP1 [Sesamum calycinum]|uniref:Protein-tyrosine-phosphatase PTP1 n=1 Tax=Sesamum calycinum TaxID=2727403 RepID=A0AAW2JDM9_9LAMI